MQFHLVVADVSGVRWRLLAGNNRELGRGLTAYPDVETCRAGLERTLLEPPSLVPAVMRVDHCHWGWLLRAGVLDVVGSGAPVRPASAVRGGLRAVRLARIGGVGAKCGHRRRAVRPPPAPFGAASEGEGVRLRHVGQLGVGEAVGLAAGPVTGWPSNALSALASATAWRRSARGRDPRAVAVDRQPAPGCRPASAPSRRGGPPAQRRRRGTDLRVHVVELRLRGRLLLRVGERVDRGLHLGLRGGQLAGGVRPGVRGGDQSRLRNEQQVHPVARHHSPTVRRLDAGGVGLHRRVDGAQAAGVGGERRRQRGAMGVGHVGPGGQRRVRRSIVTSRVLTAASTRAWTYDKRSVAHVRAAPAGAGGAGSAWCRRTPAPSRTSARPVPATATDMGARRRVFTGSGLPLRCRARGQVAALVGRGCVRAVDGGAEGAVVAGAVCDPGDGRVAGGRAVPATGRYPRARPSGPWYRPGRPGRSRLGADVARAAGGGEDRDDGEPGGCRPAHGVGAHDRDGRYRVCGESDRSRVRARGSPRRAQRQMLPALAAQAFADEGKPASSPTASATSPVARSLLRPPACSPSPGQRREDQDEAADHEEHRADPAQEAGVGVAGPVHRRTVRRDLETGAGSVVFAPISQDHAVGVRRRGRWRCR